MSDLLFNIIEQYVEYGGPPGDGGEVLHKNVTADFVKGFFANIEQLEQVPFLDSFKTKDDSMGCFTLYKVVVSNIDKFQNSQGVS